MESSEALAVTIKDGGVIQFQGLLSEPDVSEEILEGVAFAPTPEETTGNKAEESVGSPPSLAGQESSQGPWPTPPPPADLNQAPSPPTCKVTPQADTAMPKSEDMPQTSPLGFSLRKVSNFVRQSAAVQG